MHQYSDYRGLRGFNVIPSWAARIEQAWWDYDPVLFREEVALARGVHANCIRLWIEYSAWMADPDKIRDRFLDAVPAIDEAGMKTMPCLFNRWHDIDFDYGGTYPHSWFYHPQANERYGRSGVWRPRVPWKPRVANTASGSIAFAECSPPRFSRGPDVHADAWSIDDGGGCTAQRRVLCFSCA